MKTLTLLPYQERGVEFLHENPEAMLMGKIGSGKTVILLSYIRDMVYCGMVGKVLIIAPPGVATGTFPDELRKWKDFQQLTFEVLHGPKKWDRLKKDADIYICSYDAQTLGRIFSDEQHGLVPDMVCCDESHNLKSQSTKRWKVMDKVMPHVPYKVLMTGTIMGNALTDLWAQYKLIDGGRRLFRSESSFLKYWFFPVGYGARRKWAPRKSAREEIAKQVAGITYEIDDSQVVLTELTEEIVPITLPDKVMEAYNILEEKAFLELEEEKTVTAFSIGSIMQKTQQLASGFLYVGEGKDRETIFVHDEKIKALKAELDAAGDEGVLIIANYQEEFRRLQEEIPGVAVINGKTTKPRANKIKDAWNRGEIKRLAIHPKSAGEGLNLQYGGCRQVWMSREWSVIKHQQTVGRSHRKGQTQDVVIKYLIAKRTIDEVMHAANASHIRSAKKLVNALKSFRASKTARRNFAP